MSIKKFIVAVDGPAGTGKSTVCKTIAKELRWSYFNTGAIYRGIALVGQALNLDLSQNEDAHKAAIEYMKNAHWDLQGLKLIFNGKDLSHLITHDQTAQLASYIAKNPQVRQMLIPLQRDLVEGELAPGVVVEGRDIGTVIFPNADLKIFLTADLESRTKRRLQQLQSEQANTNFEQLSKTLSARDLQDSNRQSAPLSKAHDAVEVDTSKLTQAEVVNTIIALIKR